MCLNLAAGKDNYRVKRGQFEASLSYLAERWTWPRSKVRRFLNKLEQDEIEIVKPGSAQQAAHLLTQITVRNYNKLNPLMKPEVKPEVKPGSAPNKEKGNKGESNKRQTVSFPMILFDYWQSRKSLRTHRDFTPGMESAITNRMKMGKGYTQTQLKTAVSNYERLAEIGCAPGFGKWGIVEVMTSVKQFDNLLDDDWEGFTSRSNGHGPPSWKIEKMAKAIRMTQGTLQGGHHDEDEFFRVLGNHCADIGISFSEELYKAATDN